VADFGSYQQINFQVPWEAQGNSTLVIAQGPLDRAQFEGIPSAGWAVFFSDSSRNVIAQHANDYRLVTADNPARPGEWIIAYASNLGPVQNQPASGVPARADLLSPVIFQGTVSLLFNAPGQVTTVQTTFVGLVPGSIGVYQVNFRVPENSPVGSIKLKIETLRFCGFFFQQGCGRGFVSTTSLGANLPVAH
jgi:uncharacterized protein (TIGR03437 family)